ncbi:MAG: DUF11 domain-containing protein, partial [Chloroflexi bacterium]|nr:DUF11 domain-containing protein [Chloroflexota bacterium]
MFKEVRRNIVALSLMALAVFALLASTSSAQSDKYTFEPASVSNVKSSRLGELVADDFPWKMYLPIVVAQSTEALPDLLTIDTRRDAGSQALAGLTAAVAITDLTVETSGLTIAAQEALSLSQDPTNNDPYDNLNDGTVQYFNVSVPAVSMRLVAEAFESTALETELFVGTGLVPSAATQVCSGGTIEYCNIDNPAEGDWWILVQNWSESAAPPDMMTLAYGVVVGDEGNMIVDGPASVPAGTPFDLTVFWDEPAMAANDRLYGRFSVGSDAGNPGNVGSVNVDLARHADDVTKTVSADTAVPGDALTYTIIVQPNVTTTSLTYTLTDTIPAGMTYAPGSVTATGGTVAVVGDTLTWTGVIALPGFTYAMETSATDTACAAPLAAVDGVDDAYVDLAAFGFAPDPNIFGDSIWATVDFSGGAFDFFGSPQGEILNFTDDGFVFFDPSTPGAAPGMHQPIPTAAEPNSLLATFWRDMEIVYDGVRGVSLANLTSGGIPVAGVIEFDGVEDAPASGGPTYDFELVAYYEADPGRYEYIFAYNNLTGPTTLGAIGLENTDGSDGVQYGYDDLVIADGMAICFDLIEVASVPIEITYGVTVDAGASGVLTNNVVHNTDNPGSMEAGASVDVVVEPPTFTPTPTSTSTSTPTATFTPTPTSTSPPTATPTPTSTFTPTPTSTSPPTTTPTPTSTFTPTPTSTFTPTPTSTFTP